MRCSNTRRPVSQIGCPYWYLASVVGRIEFLVEFIMSIAAKIAELAFSVKRLELLLEVRYL